MTSRRQHCPGLYSHALPSARERTNIALPGNRGVWIAPRQLLGHPDQALQWVEAAGGPHHTPILLLLGPLCQIGPSEAGQMRLLLSHRRACTTAQPQSHQQRLSKALQGLVDWEASPVRSTLDARVEDQLTRERLSQRLLKRWTDCTQEPVGSPRRKVGANLLLERTRTRPACWASRKDSFVLGWVERLQVWTAGSLGYHLRLGSQPVLSHLPSLLSACNDPGSCLHWPTVCHKIFLALPATTCMQATCLLHEPTI